MSENNLGKKVFFLYPHSVIKDEMLDQLIAAEYEAYILKDHNRALRLLKKYPDSILFINIDEVLKEPEWESYIRSILSSSLYTDARLGIFTYNEDQDLARKYLIDHSLPAGFIRLKLGFQETRKILLSVLDANEAKGRRKFVRAQCSEDPQAMINIDKDGSSVQGKLLDISSAGSACALPEEQMFPKNTLLKNVQLQLRGARIMVDVIVMGTRSDNPRVHVLLFNPKSLDEIKREKIFHYIRLNLQKRIESVSV